MCVYEIRGSCEFVKEFECHNRGVDVKNGY